MSCYPPCQVPEFILPKELQDKRRSKCIGMKCRENCTSVQLLRIKKRRNKCWNPAMAEMLKCSACQDEQKRRMAAASTSHQACWLQNFVRRHPEIPSIFKLPYEPKRFIGYGYTEHDCYHQEEIENPCKARGIWRRKQRQYIKNLSKHYNKKVTSDCDHPVENYIRMNLSNLYHPCGQTIQAMVKKANIEPILPYIKCGCANQAPKSGH